jgi:hypothetical protein
MLVYLYGIFIFSDTIEKHARRVRMVFERIREANFELNIGKCTCAVRELAHLGHVVSASGMSTDMSKVAAINTFPLPWNVRNV